MATNKETRAALGAGTPHPDALLAAFALDDLAPTQRGELAQHLLLCPRCELELTALREALSHLTLALPERRPSPGARGRLWQALARATQAPPLSGEEQAPSAGRLAAFFDIPEPQAAHLLGTLDDAAGWLSIPGPGAGQLQAVSVGPGRAGQMGMLVRFPAGFRMPRHQHRGSERALVLRGGFRSSEGATYHPGDEAWSEAGDSHELYVLPDGECALALLLREGIEFRQEPEGG